MDFEDVVAYFRGMSLTASLEQLSELLDNIMLANPEVDFYDIQDALEVLHSKVEE